MTDVPTRTYSDEVSTIGTPERRWPADVLLALAAGLVMVVGTGVLAENTASTPPDLVGWLLLVAAAGVLLVRRRHPAAVMWAAIGIGLIYDNLGNPGAFYTVAIGLGIYSVAGAGHRWLAVAGVVVALGSFAIGDLLAATGHLLTVEGALWFGGWMTAAVLLGEVSRARTDYLAAVEQRAVEAERTREEEARRRAGEERMRIARDLHDVLAHSISIINVQSGAALHHLDVDPEKTREALETVRRTGKQALTELRTSIGVLRDPDADPTAPTAPTPGIEDVDDLVAVARDSGLDVTYRNDVDRAAIPADIGLAIYRIVQEALTNITRHARASKASVAIDSRPGEVLFHIDDDGRGHRAHVVEGHGITGMRERVAALGGDLHAAPGAAGGFLVEGSIPLRARS